MLDLLSKLTIMQFSKTNFNLWSDLTIFSGYDSQVSLKCQFTRQIKTLIHNGSTRNMDQGYLIFYHKNLPSISYKSFYFTVFAF